ncbi:unnamed protein product [Peronospora destructor]|uniref:DUF7492 domain-containing protein n=1 Tax=Peronospora destructor TaxID=86335 RepID=A0AAV0UUM8_9STRA|nr:unnamed protein product [Peronospora destructor]
MVCVVSAETVLLPLVVLSFARQFAEGHSSALCFDTNLTKVYDESASYIFGGAQGNGFCEGYAAGYKGRGIGMEDTYKILKNEVEAGAPVCKDVGPNPYTDWCTRVTVPPEVAIYFAYLPNGHIVKDKKAIGTQHGIYWTGQVGTSLTSTHDMIPENLVTGNTVDFDDGNCGETVDFNGNPSGRAGDGKPCIGSFAIPKGSPPGIYKMVWYWEFWLDNPNAYKDPNLARGYFGAAYTSCFEVEVTSGGSIGNGSTTSNAETPVGKPGPPDALMAPEPIVAAEADQPSVPGTPDLTPPIAAASAPMGSDAEIAPTNTPPLPEAATPASVTAAPEAAPTNTPPLPEAMTPASVTAAPEAAPTNTPPLPEAMTPASVTAAPEAALTDTPEAMTLTSTTSVPKAQAPAPAAPMALPVVPKFSLEVPASPMPFGRGCRARVRSSVMIDD